MGQLFLKVSTWGRCLLGGNWNTTNVQLHKEPFLGTRFNLHHISDIFQWCVSSPYWLVPWVDAILTYAKHFILDISLHRINLKYFEENTYPNFINEQIAWERLSNSPKLCLLEYGIKFKFKPRSVNLKILLYVLPCFLSYICIYI